MLTELMTAEGKMYAWSWRRYQKSTQMHRHLGQTRSVQVPPRLRRSNSQSILQTRREW